MSEVVESKRTISKNITALEKLKKDIGYYEVEPEESDFYTIGVDVTHRCNMECANCYSPIRNLPDVPLSDLETFFSRLGRRTEIRLTGGEPTLRSDLVEIVRAIKKYGQRATIMTNGLKFSDYTYAKKLFEAGLKFIALSLNGADFDDVYKITDGVACSKKKMQALKNCADIGYFLNLNCILIKGVNNNVPKRIHEILNELNVKGVMRFRNIGKMGRYMNQENFTFDEMINLIVDSFGVDKNVVQHSHVINGYNEEHNVLFQIPNSSRSNSIWVKITDWRPTEDSIPDPKSSRRGRMSKSLKVAPFFEHSKVFGY